MQFYNYLNESVLPTEEQINEMIDTLRKDCKPFLDELWKTGNRSFIYSGRSNHTLGSNLIIKKKIRKDRRPLTSPKELQDQYDIAFKKKFGIKARSQSIFCTGDEESAKSYGNPYIVLPIGKYKYLWNKDIGDLFTISSSMYTDSVKKNPSEEFKNSFFNLYDWRGLINQIYPREYFYTLLRHFWKYAIDYDNETRDFKEFEKEWKPKIKDATDKVIEGVVNTYTDKDLSKAINSGNEIMIHSNEVYLINIKRIHDYESTLLGKDFNLWYKLTKY